MSRIDAFRTSLLLLALGLAACDKRPATPSGTAPEASAEPAEPPAAGILQAQVTLDRPFITALSGGHTATVPFDPSWRYAWTIEGGRITEGAETREARYEAGASGEVILRCRILGPTGAALLSSAQQTIVPPPEILAFESVPAAFTEGATLQLTWSVRQAAKLTLDPGGQDVLRLGAIQVKPAAATTYVLTAANLAGTTTTREVKVDLAPPPRILAFRWEGSRRLGEPLSLKAEFEGGEAEIRQGDTLLGASKTSPLSVTVTPAVGMVYTLRVLSPSGAATSQTLSAAPKPAAPANP